MTDLNINLVQCPHCQTKYSLKNNTETIKFQCSRCMNIFKVDAEKLELSKESENEDEYEYQEYEDEAINQEELEFEEEEDLEDEEDALEEIDDLDQEEEYEDQEELEEEIEEEEEKVVNINKNDKNWTIGHTKYAKGNFKRFTIEKEKKEIKNKNVNNIFINKKLSIDESSASNKNTFKSNQKKQVNSKYEVRDNFSKYLYVCSPMICMFLLLMFLSQSIINYNFNFLNSLNIFNSKLPTTAPSGLFLNSSDLKVENNKYIYTGNLKNLTNANFQNIKIEKLLYNLDGEVIKREKINFKELAGKNELKPRENIEIEIESQKEPAARYWTTRIYSIDY